MELPEKWAGWTIGHLIGEGAYGSVYTIRHEDGRTEAVKIISAPEDPEIVRQCLREIEIMQRLSEGPHIVRVTDFAVEDGEEEGLSDIFIRMEFLTDINTWMDEDRRSEREVVRMGIEICEALDFCHAQHLIHRDIKPENIFIRPETGEFKLGDFGLARYLDPEENELTIAGTESYMAPEVAHGGEYGADADLYSLGLVMYRLLNRNRMPFLDPDKQLLTHQERMEAEERRLSGETFPFPADASDETFEVLRTACAADRARRYVSAAEMEEALRKVQKLLESGKQTRSSGNGHTGGASGKTAHFRGRRAAVILMILVAGLGAAVIFMAAGRRSTSTQTGVSEAYEEANGDVYEVDAAYYLPVRTDDHEVYLAEPGVRIKVLSPTGEMITKSGIEGTVNLDYVRSESDESNTNYGGLVNGGTPDEDTLCWLTAAASVYEQNNESGTVLTQAEKGTPFYVLDTGVSDAGTEMSEIVFLDSGETGWVSADLLTEDPETAMGLTFAGYIRNGDSVL